MESASFLWQDVHFQIIESQASALLHDHLLLHRAKRSKSKDASLIFIPEKGGKQCRPSKSISSIGFLALVTSVVNAVISASNNINNNNNNRNNNNNDLNDNNNNVQVGNLGSMQMNMNMVMAGRQLEKFKHEKKAIKQKIRALQKEASVHNNSTSNEKQKESRPLLSAPTFVQQEDNDWSKDVRKELSSILEGIPTIEDKPTDNNKITRVYWGQFGTLEMFSIRFLQGVLQHGDDELLANLNAASPIQQIIFSWACLLLTFGSLPLAQILLTKVN